MDLNTFLKANKIKGYAFAKTIGVNKTYLSGLRRGRCWPSRKLMLRISEATDGQVTADSFLNLQEEKTDDQK
jgi:transcriptional regulator with XRE-family HTH domain